MRGTGRETEKEKSKLKGDRVEHVSGVGEWRIVEKRISNSVSGRFL